MAVVQLKKGEQKRIEMGHPWVYDNEIQEVNGSFSPGDIVEVVDHRGKFIGRGYINPHSKIRVRILTRKEEPITPEFFQTRIEAAVALRRALLPGVESCRLVNGEADFLPGLIVDRYGDIIVIQTLTLGIDVWKPVIVDILRETVKPRGIYERNDVPVRSLEGLNETSGFLSEPFDPIVKITENSLQMWVDVAKGQKTGHFLDQRENRDRVAAYARGRRVLDCFCHTGGFSLNAVRGGAAEVEGIDLSESALDVARANAILNGMDTRCKFTLGNVFDELRQRVRQKRVYDLIILDPPAFAKNAAALEGAIRGYKEINLRAMKLLSEGGFLVSCSCSQHMSEELLLRVITDASVDAGRRVRILEKRAQGVDHPILLAAPETYYLKCFILQVF